MSGQVTKMLTMLPKRGPKAFDKFINVLLNTSQDHVATKLRVTEGTSGSVSTNYTLGQLLGCDHVTVVM